MHLVCNVVLCVVFNLSFVHNNRVSVQLFSVSVICYKTVYQISKIYSYQFYQGLVSV